MLDAIIRANQLKFAFMNIPCIRFIDYGATRYFLPELHRMNNRVLYLAPEDTLLRMIYNWNIRFNFHRRLPAQS